MGWGWPTSETMERRTAASMSASSRAATDGAARVLLLLAASAFADSGGIHSFGAFEVGGVAHLVVEVLSIDFDTSALWLVRLEPVD